MKIPNEDRKESRKAWDATYREKHRERCRIASRKFRAKNLERTRREAVEWRNRKIASLSPEELKAFRAKDVAYAKARHLKNKEKIFAAYGGAVCKCCGETERCFLSIDHIENNGYQLFKAGVHPQGTAFYSWIVKNNFPSGFQILCMNCQFGKKNNKGICPHQVTRNDYSERK